MCECVYIREKRVRPVLRACGYNKSAGARIWIFYLGGEGWRILALGGEVHMRLVGKCVYCFLFGERVVSVCSISVSSVFYPDDWRVVL